MVALLTALVWIGTIGFLGWELKNAPLPTWHPTYHCSRCNRGSCENCGFLKEAKENGRLFPYAQS